MLETPSPPVRTAWLACPTEYREGATVPGAVADWLVEVFEGSGGGGAVKVGAEEGDGTKAGHADMRRVRQDPCAVAQDLAPPTWQKAGAVAQPG